MDGLASSAHARPKAAHTHPARESEQQTELLLPWGATPKMKMIMGMMSQMRKRKKTRKRTLNERVPLT